MIPKHRLLVAGGGTGGHVLAGVAIADAYRGEHQDAEVLFVGARGGIEERLVPRAGFSLELLSLGALKGVGAARRIATLLKVPIALLRSLMILARFRPTSVIGVGGYASGPVVLLARLVTRARVAILEQNAIPGFTNRVLGWFAHRVFLAFPPAEPDNPVFAAKKVEVTGNPVRKVMVPLPAPDPAKPFTVFVFGGSQGAMGINTMVLEALALLKEEDATRFKTWHWIHQTGVRDHERVKTGYLSEGVPSTHARVEEFIHDMPECYAAATVVVCRSGSSTLSELAAVGRAAVLVPFPEATDNHQEANARIFERAGASEVLLQGKELGRGQGRALLALLYTLEAQPERLRAMCQASRSLHPGDSARRIVGWYENA